MRVAIVGFGPKGLHALERLLDHAHALGAADSLVIDLFEADPNPGAGPNYAPEQPDYLRMNFAADLIDLWWPESHAVPPAAQRSFVRWRAPRGAVEAYPPRAEVGRYLSDGFESLLRHAPRAATVRLRATPVEAVLANGPAWDVSCSGAVAGTYDEVLIATGHAPSSPTGLAAAWSHAARLVPRVFPVERWLTRSEVAPASAVAIRGFGLTFLDAAIALTEGRGGSFRPGRRSFELVYEPSPDQVALIAPLSRTGRPMLAKPGPDVTVGLHELSAIALRGRAELAALDAPVDLCHDLLPILARTAGDSLLAATGARCNPDEWFSNAATGVANDEGSSAAEAIERSLEVGAGLAPPDLAWAVAHAWRALYPAIVQRLGDGGLRERDWPAFQRLAAEMERVAFGPSPLNAAKLLALVEAGVVDLSLVHGAALVDRDGRTFLAGAAGEQAVDVVIDAVLPGPGAQPGHDPLLDGLVAAGHARIAAARRGLDVALDGSCRGRAGGLSPGLAAIGRPTEDAVIGNDTLSRTLHPLADRWARRVVERARELG
jgi:uncharacterized NAD(P)/FAD-binding protein YdhS